MSIGYEQIGLQLKKNECLCPKDVIYATKSKQNDEDSFGTRKVRDISNYYLNFIDIASLLSLSYSESTKLDKKTKNL